MHRFLQGIPETRGGDGEEEEKRKQEKGEDFSAERRGGQGGDHDTEEEALSEVLVEESASGEGRCATLRGEAREQLEYLAAGTGGSCHRFRRFLFAIPRGHLRCRLRKLSIEL